MDKLLIKVRKLLETMNLRQFLKFVIVGIINTVIFYSIYYIMLQQGVSYVVALTVGTLVGIINSYILNKFFTFKSRKASASETVKFFVISCVQYLLNLLIIHVCVNFMGISPELAGLIAISISVFVSYFGHKFWSFRS